VVLVELGIELLDLRIESGAELARGAGLLYLRQVVD
jgi:hypothetical protein